MTDQSAETRQNQTGPVTPPKPNVSGFGKRTRGQILANAMNGGAAAAPPAVDPVPPGTPPESPSSPVEEHTPGSPSEAQAAAEKQSGDTAGLSAEMSPPGATPSGRISADAQTGEPTTNETPPVDERQRSAERPPAVGESESVAEPAGPSAEESSDDYKSPQQAYVPSGIAKKFRQMQKRGNGATAELIVLTAVNKAASRMPELIAAARGPVQEGGLFPGLPVLDKNGKIEPAEPNDRRIQYQLSAKYQGPLNDLVKRYKLPQSVVVRLALGNFFGVPVSIERVN